MLSLFPNLLSYTFFAPLLVRLAVAGILLFATYPHVFSKKTSARMRAVAIGISLPALLLAVGLWTQAAALIIALLFLADTASPRPIPILHAFNTNTRILLAVIALSLLVSGAGAYAIDLPL